MGRSMNRFGVFTLVLIGIIAATLVVITMRIQASSRAIPGETATGGSTIPPPQKIEDLLERADIVLIGTATNIVKVSTFSGYGQDGQIIQGRFPDQPNADLPYTDFSLEVEQAIRSDDAVQQGKPIILRMLGHPKQGEDLTRDQQSSFPLSAVGERRLYFLSKNPDGTYGLYYGAWSRLDIDATVVTVSDGTKTPVQFEGQLNDSKNFVSRVVELAPRIPIQSGGIPAKSVPDQSNTGLQEQPTTSTP